MRYFKLLTLTLLVLGLFVNSTNLKAQVENQLKGDASAVTLVEKLLENLGGKEIWGRSKQLHIKQEGWFTGPSEQAVEETWRDLLAPNQHMHIVGRYTETTSILTKDFMWIKRKDQISELPRESHEQTINSWGNGMYIMLGRLARGDQQLKLRLQEPSKVLIADDADKDLCWFEINDQGFLIKWGTTTEDDDGNGLEYIYGPFRSFGNIYFPAWGTSNDGSWRYNYLEVDLYFNEMDPELLKRE